jgi:hypothetical protein
VTVTLTPEQELRAAAVGFARRRIALEQGHKSRFYGNLWGGNIEGACAEFAVAIYTGLPWTGEPVWTVRPAEALADVGERIEVRWVAPGRHEALLNFDARQDCDDRFYVLVRGYSPRYEILGYVLGSDARDHQTKTYPERTVHRVPASALKPLPGERERAALAAPSVQTAVSA